MVVSDGVVIILSAFLFSVWLGSLHAPPHGLGRPLAMRKDAWLGYAAGGCFVAIAAVAAYLGRSSHPTWPNVTEAGSFLPALNAFQFSLAYVGGLAFAELLIPSLDSRIRSGAGRVFIYAVVGLAGGAFMVESSIMEWIGAGLGSGLSLLILAELMRRCGVAILIPVATTVWVVGLVRVLVLRPYPGAVELGALAVLLIAAISWVWFRGLAEPK